MKQPALRVLGPLSVVAHGREVAVKGRMPRMVLATLLLQPNQLVHSDTLVDLLWPEGAPRSAVANLRTYVCRLRSTLTAVQTDGGHVNLVTRPGGYLLEVDPDTLDLTVFERLAERAQQAWQAHDAAVALRLADDAVALWRGRLLEGLPPCVAWAPTATRLTALRDELVELATDARLATGQYRQALVELRARIATDPLREGWWRGLMLALHGSGQRAEALRTYAQARRILRDELGVDPGPQLRDALNVVLGCRHGSQRDTDRPGPVVADGSPGPAADRWRHDTRGWTPDVWLALALLAGQQMPVRFFGVPLPPIDTSQALSVVEPEHLDRITSDPVAWFEAERPHLLAAVESAVTGGYDEYAWRLAAALAPYFDLRCQYDDWLRSHECALPAARRCGDPRAEAILLRNIGQVHLFHDSYPEAEAAFTAARDLFIQIGDRHGEAVVYCGYGALHRLQGRLGQALAAHRQALRLFRAVGDRDGESVVLIAIGRICFVRNRLDMAQQWLTKAYTVASELGDRHRQAQALHRLAMLRARQGDHATALTFFTEALGVLEELGDEHCTAYVRQSFGEMHLESGDVADATTLLANALRVHERLGDRLAAATVTTVLGECHQASNRTRLARNHLTRALRMWHALGMAAPAAKVAAALRALHTAGDTPRR